MITPEAQKYIADSRASGMSDDQIRAALSEQGWLPEDINAGMSGSTIQATPVPTTSGRNMPTWLKILLILLALGLVVSVFLAIIGRVLIANLMNRIDNPPGTELNTGTDTNNPFDPSKRSGNNPDGQLAVCGGWPANTPEEDEAHTLFKKENKVPGIFPDGWEYPKGEYIGTFGYAQDTNPWIDNTRPLGWFFYCTDDSISTVFNYYQNLKLADWRIDGDYIPDEYQNEFTNGGQFLHAQTSTQNNAYYTMQVIILPQTEKTLVWLHYGVSELGE